MEPVDTLLAIEAIKQLKAQYFQRLDFKDWQGLEQLFTDDAVIDYSGHARNLIEQHGRTDVVPAPQGWIFTGGTAAVAFLRPHLAEVISVHHGHDPQIKMHAPDAASGFWALYDRLEARDGIYHGYGHYEEDYRRVDGRWLISRLVLTRLSSALERKGSSTNSR